MLARSKRSSLFHRNVHDDKNEFLQDFYLGFESVESDHNVENVFCHAVSVSLLHLFLDSRLKKRFFFVTDAAD
jgi:hypothetical protein